MFWACIYTWRHLEACTIAKPRPRR
jgi:hypothetical protein